MLFSSITFLYYFLPITLLVYFLVPKRMKNPVLLLTSLIFYAWGEPRYVLIMIVSIIVGYAAGRLIETFYETKYAKYILAGIVLVHLGIFIYFKYTDFIIGNLNRLTGNAYRLLNIALPIGISFYTFQILSYELDVYRGKVKAQKNPIYLATYISMFPQLIAGPIVRYSDIQTQLEVRKSDYENIALGIRRFIIGLGKKVLIANTLGELCEIFKVSEDLSLLYFWLYAISFTLHIYYDFSGYSDMAIGLGKILGFDFMENFNYPYISKSVTEFWRRWHMSLGQWFRDYVYIPLGGNRCSKARWILNIVFVWFLTGFWHGAQWNFALWGLYFALLLIIEKMWLGHLLEKNAIIGHVYLCIIVVIGFVLFNASSLFDAAEYIGAMFGWGKYPLVSAEFIYYMKSYALILVIGLIGATPVINQAARKVEQKLGKMAAVWEIVILIGIFVLSTAYLVDGSFNPFLYFRF